MHGRGRPETKPTTRIGCETRRSQPCLIQFSAATTGAGGEGRRAVLAGRSAPADGRFSSSTGAARRTAGTAAAWARARSSERGGRSGVTALARRDRRQVVPDGDSGDGRFDAGPAGQVVYVGHLRVEHHRHHSPAGTGARRPTGPVQVRLVL